MSPILGVDANGDLAAARAPCAARSGHRPAREQEAQEQEAQEQEAHRVLPRMHALPPGGLIIDVGFPGDPFTCGGPHRMRPVAPSSR